MARSSAEVTCLEPDPITGLCQAVVVRPGALVHTTQILPVDEAGLIIGKGEIDKQAQSVFEQLSVALGSAGTTLERVVKLNIYARDTAVAAQIKSILGERFSGGRLRAAVTFVTGRLVHPDALIAMDAVAETGRGSKEVAWLESRRSPGLAGADAAVLPQGRQVYIAGQAEPGDLMEATRKTMASLKATLEFLKLDFRQVVSMKAFIQPIERATEAREEIARWFPNQKMPPLIFVEWISGTPIEIEMIAAAGETAGGDVPVIEFLTPPGMNASPIYSRVSRINRGDLIYVGSLYGEPGTSGESQVRKIFDQLKALMEKGGSDFNHLAKATYYVSDNDSSAMLNKIRPEFYDPKRPPAASKAMVSGVGLDRAGITIDMIAVRSGGEK